MQLTEHFSAEEATDSSTAQRAGIDNKPNDEQLGNMRIAASGMEDVRTILGFPIHIGSWLRVEALEKLLTKKDFTRWCDAHSQIIDDAAWAVYFARKAHPKGFAVDFTCPQFGTPEEIVHKLQEAGLKFDQLIMEGTWVHVSFAPAMRGEVLAATFTDGVPSYTKGWS